jgi:hypothetical protein
MTSNQLIARRLSSQHLVKPTFSTPGEVVSWMGAVQAQDYAGSLWGIGMRVENCTEAMVEKAIDDKAIVRSWPMRGTLHLVPSGDLRWMLKYLTPRVIKRAGLVYRQTGLDEKLFRKAEKVLIDALGKSGRLTRPAIYEAFERKGIDPAESRGLHLLGYHAQRGLICCSGRIGKQQSFALLDEWLPASRVPKQNEAFAILCERYFRSHGPAAIDDFMWWSGLTRTEALAAVQSLGTKILHEKVGERTLYFMDMPAARPGTTAHLLPPYDEYSVAYRDRNDILSPDHAKASGNGIFSGAILFGGRIEGTWKRTPGKKTTVSVKGFRKLTAPQLAAIFKTVENYSAFIKQKCSVVVL